MTNTPSPTLTSLDNPISLEMRAYDALKAAILSFALMPGEPLVEAELARRLGISKTPVRNALARLEKEGFIAKQPYKGYNVAEISQQTVIEIFAVRAALEGLAAREATAHLTPGALAEAAALLAEHAGAAERGDLEQASTLNRQFHDLLLRLANNAWLTQILSNLDEHLQRYRLLSAFQAGRLEKSVAEHAAILQALQAGDAAAAEVAARQHLFSVSADLAEQDFNQLVGLAHQQRSPAVE
ncbi:MAG TPA: GntR family transcriptional regulator [Anaerolineaceae bacterium]|nr:GntR family transcriptional regulator [Anaerolineaceae bacterium]